jgi:hypothetical protein
VGEAAVRKGFPDGWQVSFCVTPLTGAACTISLKGGMNVRTHHHGHLHHAQGAMAAVSGAKS